MGTPLVAIGNDALDIEPDIKAFVTGEADAAKRSFMHHVMLFTPVTEEEDVNTKLESAFRDADNINSMLAQKNMGSVYLMADALKQEYDADVKFQTSDITIPMLLGAVRKVCERVFEYQLDALFKDDDSDYEDEQRPTAWGANFRIKPALREFWKGHWNDIVDRIDGRIPFFAETTDLQTHFDRSNDVIQKYDIPVDNLLMENIDVQAVKRAMFLLMKPWLTFKYLASYVDGDWNNSTTKLVASFSNQRYATLAIYRIMLETVTKIREYVTDDESIKGAMIDFEGDPAGTFPVLSFMGGGDAQVQTRSREGYRIHVIRGGRGTVKVERAGKIEILLVGGGGGAGAPHGPDLMPGGGGGAGGLLYDTQYEVQVGSEIEFEIGNGGNSGSNGMNTTFDDIEVDGGGGGGGSSNVSGKDGGSGGGAAAHSSISGRGGDATDGDVMGNSGGNTYADAADDATAGGGGGAGSSGNGSTTSEDSPGKGGNGRRLVISGSSMIYAGGGGGGALTSDAAAGLGGAGGGGRGGEIGNNGRNGTNGTGGGGGSNGKGGSSSGRGGSGVIVIRYRVSAVSKNLVKYLERYAFGLSEAVTQRYVTPAEDAMPGIDGRVSRVSKDAKAFSLEVYQIDQELKSRKNNLVLIMHNIESKKLEVKRAQIVFWVVLVLLVIYVLAILTSLGKTNTAWLFHVIIATGLVLFMSFVGLRKLLESKITKNQNHESGEM